MRSDVFILSIVAFGSLVLLFSRIFREQYRQAKERLGSSDILNETYILKAAKKLNDAGYSLCKCGKSSAFVAAKGEWTCPYCRPPEDMVIITRSKYAQ